MFIDKFEKMIDNLEDKLDNLLEDSPNDNKNTEIKNKNSNNNKPKEETKTDYMYNEKIEKLIEMALADGELTEKEKQVLFKNAEAQGIDLDEFEMVLDAKLHKLQNPGKSAPKSEKVNDVKKCPACGAIIESFSVVCKECGYEIRNQETTNSTKDFAEKFTSTKFQYSSDEEKFIISYPIPNSKEDLIEFATYVLVACSNGENLNAWHGKIKQIVQKARISMKNDQSSLEDILRIEKEVENALKVSKRRKTLTATYTILAFVAASVGLFVMAYIFDTLN